MMYKVTIKHTSLKFGFHIHSNIIWDWQYFTEHSHIFPTFKIATSHVPLNLVTTIMKFNHYTSKLYVFRFIQPPYTPLESLTTTKELEIAFQPLITYLSISFKCFGSELLSNHCFQQVWKYYSQNTYST